MDNNNSVINLKAGDILCATGEDTNNVYLIIKGKITSYAPYGTISHGVGSIVGLTGAYYGICINNHIAAEDTMVQRFRIGSMNDLYKICEAYKSEFSRFVINNNKYVMDLIKIYLSLLAKCRKKDASFVLDSRINRWELDKYNGIASIPMGKAEEFFGANTQVAAAILAENSRFASVLHDACLEMADFLNINLDYVEPEPEPAAQPAKIDDENNYDEYRDEDILAELKGSLGKILKYADVYEEDREDFIYLINTFKKCSDKLSLDETVRKLRKAITEQFYNIYHMVFLKSLSDDALPSYISMFLNFGYMDEGLAGESHAIMLYKLVQNIEETCNNSHVYTMYNWLKHVLWGEKEPSRNSLDQTYDEYIKHLSKTGKLDTTLDEALEDNDAKLKFEIENMFRQSHLMTYGKVSTFIPVFIEENVMKSLPQSMMNANAVMDSVNRVRMLDYSLFFRSYVYSNEKAGITKEFVYTEVLPDIILTPCIGTNSVLWQEIEGRRRVSSARILFPIFCSGEMDTMVTNVLGKYRWEICKRIQGAYWNVASEKSLTSEFYDYLLFYKKNRDLTDPVKEKIRSSLINCRNNYGEVFAKDYEQWIMYESKGAGKLNKVSRTILAKYCPFNAQIRNELKLNPMFTEVIEGFERYRSTQRRRIDSLYAMCEKKGIEVPKELRETKAYFSK